MSIRVPCIVMLTFLFTSCAHTYMKEGLPHLVGQDVEKAFSVLGYPEAKQKFGTKTVYIWAINEQSSMVIPQTNTTSGWVGNTYYYGQSTSYQAVPVNASCTIKLAADDANRIQSWEYRGNQAGCQTYARSLYDAFLSERNTGGSDSNTTSSHVSDKNNDADYEPGGILFTPSKQ